MSVIEDDDGYPRGVSLISSDELENGQSPSPTIVKSRKTREQKREEASARNVTTANMTTSQRLRRLDRRLGKGKGARKERAQLAKSLTDYDGLLS